MIDDSGGSMSDDLTEDILPVEADDGEDSDADGLELDERQSNEIRQIFGTTLPQYLQPVEEMIQQIIANPESRAATVQAFVGTVSSLSAAASRMGFEDVYRILERLSARVGQIGDDDGRVPEEIREAILFDLEEIKELAAGLGGDQPAPASDGAPSRTIFSALGAVSGLEDAVVQKLCAAGLVTVEQLRLARPGEVAAVTGLPDAVVARVMRAVQDEAVADDAERAAAEDDDVLALPIEGGNLQTQLKQRLAAQVDVEAAVDEMRAEVQRMRANIAELRHELSRVEQRRTELRTALRSINDVLGDRVTALGRVRSNRAELAQRAEAAERALAREEDRVLDLRRRRAVFLEKQAVVGEEVAGLLERVQRMIRLAARE